MNNNKHSNKKIRAIILSAGLGTRLQPLTNHLPKCLMPVNGRPLLEYWLKALNDADVGPILVNLHYMSDIVKEWIEKSCFSKNVETVFEEQLLGTGGTLLENKHFFKDHPTMLIHGDNLCKADFNDFIKAHFSRPPGTEITMMTFDTQTPKTCGIIETDNNGVVQAFHEKVENPPGNHANAAVYIVEPQIISFLSKMNQTEIDFSTEVIPHYLGKIYTWHNNIYHRDIGTIDDYITAQIEYPEVHEMPAEHDSWKEIIDGDSNISKNLFKGLTSNDNYKIIDIIEMFDIPEKKR